MIVLWRVTGRCNLACPFCAYDRTSAVARQDADPEQVLAFGRVLAEHQQATGDQVLVSWIGGEPLLWPRLFELSVYFVRTLGLQVSTTTNGTMLALPQVRSRLLRDFAELTVSVDAVGAGHDELRGWPGGYDSLRRSVKALRSERKCGRTPVLRANVVLMRGTVDALPLLCSDLAEWGIEEITFNQLGGNDRPEFYPANRLLPGQAEQLAEMVPALREQLVRQGVRLRGAASYLSRIAASTRGDRIAGTGCRPGEHFVFLTEDGLLGPCSFTVREAGLHVNDIRSTVILQGLPERFSAQGTERWAYKCGDCHSTQVHGKFGEQPWNVKVPSWSH